MCVCIVEPLSKETIVGEKKVSTVAKCPYFRDWQEYYLGETKVSLLREVSLFQGCPYKRGVLRDWFH